MAIKFTVFPKSDGLGVERQPIGRSGGSAEQVSKPCAARLSGGLCGSEHPSVHARRFRIKRQGIPCCRRPLQAVLTTSAFIFVFGSVRTGGELGESHGGNRRLLGQHRGVDHVVIDHHRGVEHPARRLSH